MAVKMFTKIKKTNEFQSALHLKKIAEIEKEEEGVKNHKVEAFFMYRFRLSKNGMARLMRCMV